MRKQRIASMAAGVLALGTLGAGYVVTPDDPNWTEQNVRGDGESEISDEQGDSAGGAASLKQSFSDSAGKTDYITGQDFGPVADLEALSFEWFRSSDSTAPGHLTPAFEVYVADDAGNSWLLKWEGTYNGYPSNGPAVPTDEWISEDLLAGNYWRIPQTVDGNWAGGIAACNAPGDPYGCYQFDRSLEDAWLDGFDVVGLGVGIGSGWNGSFLSYADLITINDTVFDFELEAPSEDVVLENKEQCRDGGWATSTSPEFRNQGQCVSYFQANEKAGKR